MKKIKRILVDGVEQNIADFAEESGVPIEFLISIAESGTTLMSSDGKKVTIELE